MDNIVVNRFAGVCRVCMLWKSSSMRTIKHANCEERKAVQSVIEGKMYDFCAYLSYYINIFESLCITFLQQ